MIVNNNINISFIISVTDY